MKSIKEGKVRMGTLNTACRRILEAKYKLGLFDNPYKYCDVNRPKRDIFTKEHRDAARKIAGESFVLLKNAPATAQPLAAHSSSPVTASPVLPLKKQGTVAVIGPLGNTRSNMPGTWSVAARLNDYPSLYEGLKEMMAGKVNITYAKGSNLIGDAAYRRTCHHVWPFIEPRIIRTYEEVTGNEKHCKVAAGADVIVACPGKNLLK